MRHLREAQGLTQAELAELVGTSPAMISHYEHKRKTPSIERLKALAYALGVSPGILLEDLTLPNPSRRKRKRK